MLFILKIVPLQKHIMACKIDTNLMKCLAGGDHTDLQTMHQRKLELMTVQNPLLYVDICYV